MRTALLSCLLAYILIMSIVVTGLCVDYLPRFFTDKSGKRISVFGYLFMVMGLVVIPSIFIWWY